MERNLFITTYPQTKLNIKESLGIGIFTHIQLLDYFSNNSSAQIASIKHLSNNLPESVKEELQILRTVFAHGVILRDYYIKHAKNLSQEWEEFVGWWEGLNEDEVAELVIYGIKESMDYYYKHLPTIPAVEEIMKEVSLETDQLKGDRNRHNALKAVLESWSVDKIDEILPIYNDITGIKKRIISLLKGVWEFGFKEIWDSKKDYISDWKSTNISLINKSYGTNEEAIYNITGLYPDINDADRINRAEFITFIPVPNMGRLITSYELEKHIFLMFEPFLLEDIKRTEVFKTNELYLAFEGLGDANRLQIINLLANYEEMYAQQIVNKLEMNQSTVSRQLNQLHQSNLVKIRQEGTTKYFSINKDEIRKVIKVLETFLK
ncbi:metalloregulator ArsR/SmtB family transcription factor [Virgibacillus sp. 179-BFC.A HS]|uniref:Metalloregulator ArsR/SmtB family transcription factor n=1 Tax=Tigheibacillus jepli TaxID=3035914 RepID=A0ABU5CJF2_9BACI|nr:metalloregulator ArsR/SmtB family transcription factor [Virgibacillus sp. 179-BFC.A HS]MDY0406449.1 metalloregulator ArsR/SmtB family transcription factor [Virgibacillus sp. 179-BFC.A HS]